MPDTTVAELKQVVEKKDKEITRLRLWLATIAGFDSLSGTAEFLNDNYMLNTLDAVSRVSEYARFGLRGATNIPLNKAIMDELCYTGIPFMFDDNGQLLFEDTWQTQSRQH